MRNLLTSEISRYRVTSKEVIDHYGSVGDENCGVFLIMVKPISAMFIIASKSDGWEHVSASMKSRCPTWAEMCLVKSLFFKDDEVVMQLHPAKKHHINFHEYCLHLFRPINQQIPLPPKEMI